MSCFDCFRANNDKVVAGGNGRFASNVFMSGDALDKYGTVKVKRQAGTASGGKRMLLNTVDAAKIAVPLYAVFKILR